MIVRLTALFVAVAVLACSVPALADGVPREKRATVTKKLQKRPAPRRVIVEAPPPRPAVVAPAPVPLPPPPPPQLVWVPGHWTWNPRMSTHAWVPGMYIVPPPPQLAAALPLQRIGAWIGIGRRY